MNDLCQTQKNSVKALQSTIGRLLVQVHAAAGCELVIRLCRYLSAPERLFFLIVAIDAFMRPFLKICRRDMRGVDHLVDSNGIRASTCCPSEFYGLLYLMDGQIGESWHGLDYKAGTRWPAFPQTRICH